MPSFTANSLDRKPSLYQLPAQKRGTAPFHFLPGAGAGRVEETARIQFISMITHEIIGDDMQAVVMAMAAGDEIRAEAGAMTYMTGGIEMDARMQGGLLGGLTRKFLAGESLFLTYFRCTTPTGTVAFSAPYPGKVIRFPLQASSIL